MKNKLLIILGILTILLAISVSAIYQENANITTTSGSWQNSANVVDGNWGTYGYGSDETVGYRYLNYTKPEYSTNSTVWTVKDAGTTTNLSITKACWDYYTNEIYLRITSEGAPGFGSFEEGTLVNTPSGMIAIEDLNINDTVYSYNEGIENDTITNTTQRSANETMYLISVNGTQINSTANDLFYTQRGWIHTEELLDTDQLFSINENFINITSISTKEYVGNVYDLEIQNNYNYFVEDYLVHNTDRVFWDCYSGTWTVLRDGSIAGKNVYEEAIVWDIDVPYFATLTPLAERDYFRDDFDDSSLNATLWDNQGCSEVNYNGKGMLMCNISNLNDDVYIYTDLDYLGLNISQPFIIRYNATRRNQNDWGYQSMGVALLDQIPIAGATQQTAGSGLYNGNMMGQWFYSGYNQFDNPGWSGTYTDSTGTWNFYNQDYFTQYEFHYDGTRCWIIIERPDDGYGNNGTYIRTNTTCSPTGLQYLSLGEWTASSYESTNKQLYVDYIEVDQYVSTQTPNPPTDLTAYNIGETSLNLNSSGNCEEKCLIYQDGVNILNWSSFPETILGLSPSTSYEFKYKIFNSSNDNPLSVSFSNAINPTTLHPLDGEIELGTTGGTFIIAGFNQSGTDDFQYSAMGFKYHNYPTTYITGVNLFMENVGTEDLIISMKLWNSTIQNTWDNMPTLASGVATVIGTSTAGFTTHHFDTPYQVNNDTQYYVFFSLAGNEDNYWVGRIMSGYGGTSDGIAWTYDDDDGYWSILSTNAIYMNVTYEASPCLSSWTPSYTACSIGDNQTLWYNDTNACSPPTGVPVDNGTVSSCNYCTLAYHTNDTICLDTFEIITYPTYDNFASCCNLTGISADCDLPANISVSCIGAYESQDIGHVIMDGLGEFVIAMIEYAPIIVIISLLIMGGAFVGVKANLFKKVK